MGATWIKHGIGDDGDTLLIREKLMEFTSHLCLANTQSLHSGAPTKRFVAPNRRVRVLPRGREGRWASVSFVVCVAHLSTPPWIRPVACGTRGSRSGPPRGPNTEHCGVGDLLECAWAPWASQGLRYATIVFHWFLSKQSRPRRWSRRPPWNAQGPLVHPRGPVTPPSFSIGFFQSSPPQEGE